MKPDLSPGREFVEGCTEICFSFQDTTMTSYNMMEGPDIDEEGVQVQDQDNEVEIIDGEW